MATLPEYPPEKAPASLPAAPETLARPTTDTSPKQANGDAGPAQPAILRLRLSLITLAVVWTFWQLINATDETRQPKRKTNPPVHGSFMMFSFFWAVFTLDNEDFFPPVVPEPPKSDTAFDHFVRSLPSSLGYAWLSVRPLKDILVFCGLFNDSDDVGRILAHPVTLPLLAWAISPIAMLCRGASFKQARSAFFVCPWWIAWALYWSAIIRHKFYLNLIRRLWLREAVIAVEFSVWSKNAWFGSKAKIQDEESNPVPDENAKSDTEKNCGTAKEGSNE